MLCKRAAAVVYKHLYRVKFSLDHSNFAHQSHKARPNNSNFLLYCNNQISINGRQGNVQESESIFNRMPRKSTVTYTAMLTAYSQNGQIAKARKLFDEMADRTSASYNAMITALINNNCSIYEAFEIFATMPMRNAVSYAAMITGFVRRGMFYEAEELYVNMPARWRDSVCSNALISGYLKVGRCEEAARIFEAMVEKDVVAWGSMVDGYCKKGRVIEAREIFDKMPEKNVVAWTAMVDGYMKVDCFEDGFDLFLSMRRGGMAFNSTTLTILFEACGRFFRYREGVQVHGLVCRFGFDYDIIFGNSIITMYGRLGFMDEANKVFSMMSKRDAVSWNSLISGYVHNGEIEEAYRLFERMPGKDFVSWTTMITGFSSKGNLEKSIELFNMMPEKDDVTWTAIISGFVNNEQYEEALRWFIEMLRKDVRPNQLTLSSVLSASAATATLNQGSQIHAHVVKMNMESDVSIQNSLVSLYSKCGNVVDAYRIFTNIDERNIVSYNSMISGFAQNGLGEEALNLFRKMKDEGLVPNQITFLSVLSACNHVGLVEEGFIYFKSMKTLYNIEPGPEHYACMVDILGRAGSLAEAIDLINSMTFEPPPGVWGALLGAGRTHLNLDLAKLAAQHLMELEPDSATPYVVLSDLYSVIGKKRDGNRVRMKKKLKRIRKSPGCSWIILKDKVHLFLAGRISCLDLKEIEVTLQTISKGTKEFDWPKQ